MKTLVERNLINISSGFDKIIWIDFFPELKHHNLKTVKQSITRCSVYIFLFFFWLHNKGQLVSNNCFFSPIQMSIINIAFLYFESAVDSGAGLCVRASSVMHAL